jgi:enamine deaminase RidA (YjgF/YER057c/UK114 family)
MTSLISLIRYVRQVSSIQIVSSAFHIRSTSGLIAAALIGFAARKSGLGQKTKSTMQAKSSGRSEAWRSRPINSCEEPDTFRAEIIRAFDVAERFLKTAGASWDDVINVNFCHTALDDRTIGIMSEQLCARMISRKPIWTCISLSNVGEPGIRGEIRVTAFITHFQCSPLSPQTRSWTVSFTSRI